jgi:hypothetical protein
MELAEAVAVLFQGHAEPIHILIEDLTDAARALIANEVAGLSEPPVSARQFSARQFEAAVIFVQEESYEKQFESVFVSVLSLMIRALSDDKPIAKKVSLDDLLTLIQELKNGKSTGS